MADYPKASKELQEQQQSTLDLIAVQLQIANAQTGPTKDEFQKANTELLREMLEGNETQEKLVEAIEDGNDTETESINSQKGWWTKLLDHFSWERGWIEAQEKKALRAASKVKDFGKQQVDMLKSAAKGLFDLLLTGLGLLALAALFKWLSEQDWEKIYEDTVKFATEMLAEFDSFMDTLAEVGGFFAKMTAMYWAYYLFSSFSSWDEAVRSLFGIVDEADADVKGKKSIWTKLFGPDSRLRSMLRTLNNLFWYGEDIVGASDNVKSSKGFWTSLFGPESRLRRILSGIREMFSFRTVANAVDEVDDAKDLWTMFFGYDSPFRKILRFIGRFFGGTIKFAANFATAGGYSAMFGEEGAFKKLLRWVGGLFGGKGTFMTAIDNVLANPTIKKAIGFLSKIGANMLKFLGPVTWLIAGYDAIAGEGGFMDTFNKTEGSLWDKTVAGLSAAVDSLVNFFIFDTVGLIEDVVKWSIKKLMGLFGIEEKDVESADWYTFSITDYLAEAFGDYLTFLEGVFTFDTAKMAEGLKGLWGKFKGIVDWAFGTLVTPMIQWVAKNIFGFSEEEAATIDFKPMQWLEDNFLNPLISWLEGIFTMDFDAMAKSLMPEWLYNLFSSSGAEKTAAALEEMGIATDNLVAYDDVDEGKLKNLIESKDSNERKAFAQDIANSLGEFNLAKAEKERLGQLLAEYGVQMNKGGYVPPGMTVPAVLHGPEVVKPLKEIPAQERPPMQQMAPTMINAPSTSVVNSSSPTSIVGAVSSQNPQKKALGY